MDQPAFTHAAEAEVASMLTYYGVRWEHEPHTFPLRWSPEGRAIESFSPDFWLPELNLYIEVTTAKPANCRLKHRKVRLFAELHPEHGIRLLEARDIRALMVKSGSRARIDQVIGAAGQLN